MNYSNLMNIRRLYIFLSVILTLNLTFAQNLILDEITYNEIEKNIDNSHNKPDDLWKWVNIYIQKSKKERNYEAQIYAYRYASNFSQAPKNLKYADSALLVSKSANDRLLTATAYLNRGVVHMSNVQYNKALDDILVANKFANEVRNEYIIYKSQYFIAQNKIYLGLYDEANAELRKVIDFFRNNMKNSSLGKDYEIYYIYSLMSIIDTNTKIGKKDENKLLIEEAFNYLKTNNLQQFVPYFISYEGSDAFYSKDYKTAINKLTEALKMYDDQWSHITEVFYLGKSYWNLGKQHIAVKYFESIDQLHNKNNNLEPQFRSAYELLIKYHDSLNNKDLQLQYINKLMKLDKSYEKNYKYLFSTLNKKYDTKKLQEEKDRIEQSLLYKDRIIKTLIIISILIIVLALLRFYQIKKVYEKRFNELIAEKSGQNKVFSFHETPETAPNGLLDLESTNFINKDIEFYSKIPGINPQLVEQILQQLDRFEEDLNFLDPQITQKLLSEQLGTNSTYLSKVINAYKDKNFNIYVNDLRLDYIIEFMKNDWKYLNKDVKELSQIAGFSSPENFSDNFQRKFGLKPSYFIKRMKENFKISGQSHNPA